jgi:hypothetical protein
MLAAYQMRAGPAAKLARRGRSGSTIVVETNGDHEPARNRRRAPPVIRRPTVAAARRPNVEEAAPARETHRQPAPLTQPDGPSARR